MKRTVLALLGICLMSSVFTSCKKDDDGSSENYQPLTTGSSWSYNTTTTGSPDQPYTLTVTGDTTIATKKYTVLHNSLGGNTYMGVFGSNYYRYTDFFGLATTPVEELYLKDAAVGTTWELSVPITYMSTPLTIVGKYTLTEKNVTKVVGTKTFENVAHVTLAMTTTVPFLGLQTVGSADFYYAKNVGLVSNSITIGSATLGVPTTTIATNITAYTIK